MQESVIALRKLMYSATTGQAPNLGGHHGVRGFEASVGSDILKAIDTFIGKLRAGEATIEDVEQARARCSVALTAGIIGEADMQLIDGYLDNIQENL